MSVGVKKLANLSVWDTFNSHSGRLIDKWSTYFPAYEHYFSPYVGTPVRVLEIGVSHGGSLQMWKSYFGSRAEIVGVDIDPRCKDYQEDRIFIEIADQAQLPQLGDFDIVIDDGSHRIADQEASFTALWPKTRGVYLIEDIHGEYPTLTVNDGFTHMHPWMIVVERPRRLIRGNPSRELRPDEIDAINCYSDAQ